MSIERPSSWGIEAQRGNMLGAARGPALLNNAVTFPFTTPNNEARQQLIISAGWPPHARARVPKSPEGLGVLGLLPQTPSLDNSVR